MLATLADIAKVRLKIERIEEQAGDVKHTEAATSLARAKLGYNPKVPLADGLARQVEWARSLRS